MPLFVRCGLPAEQETYRRFFFLNEREQAAAATLSMDGPDDQAGTDGSGRLRWVRQDRMDQAGSYESDRNGWIRQE
jgi:hypothetical protein